MLGGGGRGTIQLVCLRPGQGGDGTLTDSAFSEQSGSIEGSVLKQFYTNLVLLPSVLDYLQYILLGLSVPLIVSAAVLVAMTQVRAAGACGECCQSNQAQSHAVVWADNPTGLRKHWLMPPAISWWCQVPAGSSRTSSATWKWGWK